jgi:hypothetical protein
MGYMVHHAIIVTGHNNAVAKAHGVALDIFDDMVTPIVTSRTNGYLSFMVAPDGSKAGWGESDDGDRRRERFVAYLDQQRYEDYSSPLDWVEVQYGDDEGDTRIVDDSDAPRRPELRNDEPIAVRTDGTGTVCGTSAKSI